MRNDKLLRRRWALSCASVSEPLPFIRVTSVYSYLSINCNLCGSHFGKTVLASKINQKIPYCSLSLNARDNIT